MRRRRRRRARGRLLGLAEGLVVKNLDKFVKRISPQIEHAGVALIEAEENINYIKFELRDLRDISKRLEERSKRLEYEANRVKEDYEKLFPKSERKERPKTKEAQDANDQAQPRKAPV